MKIVDVLVEQCREPNGLLGIIMIRFMNALDSGLNKWALGHVNLQEGKVLDIGCGGGKTARAISQMHPEAFIYGIDYSETAVRTAINRNKHKIKTGKIKISQASVSSLPFPDNFFNYITAVRTHYFWPNLAQDMKEVFRVLNTGGQFLILSELYKINYHMKQYNTNASLRKLLIDTGFEKVEILERNQCICVIAKK